MHDDLLLGFCECSPRLVATDNETQQPPQLIHVMQNFTPEVFNALTGVQQDLFNMIYFKYCGPGTPICKYDTIASCCVLL
jgi:hypothetical protein